MRLAIVSAALIVGLLGVGATPAYAAKGVKKKGTANVAHGVVTHVHHHPSKTSAGHLGTITIKTHHHKKKGTAAVAGKKVSGHSHTFTVGTNTTFAIVQGKQHQASTFAAVHVGEHVAITHSNNHATSVHIHKHIAKKGTAKKKKVK